MIDEKILITLIGIQNEALKQIAIEQRGGRAIKEEEISPRPEWQEFKEERTELLDVPKGDTLEEMVNSDSGVTEQITIEEAVECAENKDETTSKQDARQDTVDETASKAASKPRLVDVIKSYLQARRDWHYDRMSIEYGYECRKQQAADRIYGFEYMVNYIDKLIVKMEKDDETNTSSGQVM